MAHVIKIEPQIRATQIMTVFDPIKELREIIDNDMGMDVARLFDEAIAEAMGPEDFDEGDDYEAIADGYHNTLVDLMNELEEILSQKRLNRGRLERLHERINAEL